MTDNPGTRAPEPERPEDDPGRDFARDWLTIWQSELAAAAADQEALETWLTLSALWAKAASFVFRPDGAEKSAPDDKDHAARDHDAKAPDSGTDAAPRAKAAAAAPDPRDAEIARLAKRVEQLERKLERQPAGPDRDRDGDDGNAAPGIGDAGDAGGRRKPRRRPGGLAGKPAT